jgi:hypothetical protein
LRRQTRRGDKAIRETDQNLNGLLGSGRTDPIIH